MVAIGSRRPADRPTVSAGRPVRGVALAVAIATLLAACSAGTATQTTLATPPGTAAAGSETSPKCAGFAQVELDLYIASQSTGATPEKKDEVLRTMRNHADAFKLAAPDLVQPVEARLAFATKLLLGQPSDADRTLDQQAYSRMLEWKGTNGC